MKKKQVSDNRTMRGCEDFLVSMKEEKPDVFKFLCQEANKEDIFIGIRADTINLYFQGLSVTCIDRNFSCTTSKTLLGIEKKNKNDTYQKMSFDTFLESYEHIKNRILSKGGLEKKYQQNIVLHINRSSSKWYCVDMEYNQRGKRVGRFDIIAISRKRDTNNKHKVALIELKVGAGSYLDNTKAMKAFVDNPNLPSPHKTIFKEPHSIFAEEYRNLSFSSGIVGHIADYLRYLPENGYNTMLVEEIPRILRCHNQINYPVPKELLQLNSKDFAIIPEVVFLCYTNPKQENEKTIPQIKRRFANAIFAEENTSDYALAKMINKEDISSFLDLNDFLSDTDPNNGIISFYQRIQEQDFLFSLLFIDSEDKDYLSGLDRL